MTKNQRFLIVMLPALFIEELILNLNRTWESPLWYLGFSLAEAIVTCIILSVLYLAVRWIVAGK